MAWHALVRGLAALLALSGRAVAQSAVETGNHPDWPRWCGKVYQAGYPSFEPGGETVPPPILPGPPRLHVRFMPRYSLYVSSETSAEFVVNVELSRSFGTTPWPTTSADGSGPPTRFVFSITLADTSTVLVEGSVPVNSTRNVFGFPFERGLGQLVPRLEPYRVVLYGAPPDGTPAFLAESQFVLLPDKEPGNGSVTRLDNLNGGLWHKSNRTGNVFQPFLPYGYYAQASWMTTNTSVADVQRYAELGFNAATPLAQWDVARDAFAEMERLDIRFMYNFRDLYRNLTELKMRIPWARDSEALFAWWSTDEPDGWQHPFEDAVKAHDLIRSMDPYHPVAITLNCQNYYFGPYTQGADFIMHDPYPIGINSTFSKWGTACNRTYGDCGCDNCVGVPWDVASRFDDANNYEAWLGLWPKTKLFNPQTFHGEDYWFRDPTDDEALAMNGLAWNHGAKGSISWTWPASDRLGVTHGQLAKVVTKSPVLDLMLGDGPHRFVAVEGKPLVDAAFWVKDGKMLVGVVNGGYADVNEPLWIAVPNITASAKLDAVVFGKEKWDFLGGKLHVDRLPGLSTSLILLDP